MALIAHRKVKKDCNQLIIWKFWSMMAGLTMTRIAKDLKVTETRAIDQNIL